MDVEAFFARLDRIRFFEGYTEEAAGKAAARIRRNLRAGLKGERAADFERFPGLALEAISFDGELDGLPDLRILVRQLVAACLGMLPSTGTKVTREGDDFVIRLPVGPDGHRIRFEESTWVPDELIAGLNRALAKAAKGLGLRELHVPDPGQTQSYVLCTRRAHQALLRNEMVPPLESEAEDRDPRAEADAPVAPPPPFVLAPPGDVERADRMRLFKRGTWSIPFRSEPRLRGWAGVAAPEPPESSGDPYRRLTEEIDARFDRLAAAHAGVREAGDVRGDAGRVAELAAEFLFGAWRRDYRYESITLSGKKDPPSWPWCDVYATGTLAALLADDAPRLRTIAAYPDADVDTKYIVAETAYYRLLSDAVLERFRWDRDGQMAIIETYYRGLYRQLVDPDRYLRLARCLSALEAGDGPAFSKALAKFGSRPATRETPPTFSGVVDVDVSVLAALARRRGLPFEVSSPWLADKILTSPE